MSQPAIPAARDRSIDVARMIAALLIVAYHAAQSYTMAGAPPVLGYEPWQIVGVISLWGRVPFFFFLSGCFAARSLSKPGASIPDFLRKRVELLGLPYLFWNFVALVMLYVAVRRGAALQTAWEFTPKTVAMLLTGFGLNPANGPLWFVRDLLIASFFAPLLLRLGMCALLPCVAFVLFKDVPPNPEHMQWPLLSSLGYFGLGILLNHFPQGTFRRVFPHPRIALLMTLALGIAYLVIVRADGHHWQVPPLVGPGIGAAGILLFGCVITDSLPSVAAWLASRANASFMIFAANVPFFAVARQIFPKVSGAIPAAAYFPLASVVFFFAVIAVHQFLRNRAPVLLKPLTGGR